jgi:hypothetical protein
MASWVILCPVQNERSTGAQPTMMAMEHSMILRRRRASVQLMNDGAKQAEMTYWPSI